MICSGVLLAFVGPWTRPAAVSQRAEWWWVVWPNLILIASVRGTAILYLRDGAACTFPVGTLLQMVYTEQHGRRCVESVARASE
jgi:hypothetical protein